MPRKYKARISQIDDMKGSRNGGAFKRVYFQVKDEEASEKQGKKVYFWAKTDLVPGYRNYKRWENLLVRGNVLKNLELKTENTVDADSYPELMGNREQEVDIIPLQKSLWK